MSPDEEQRRLLAGFLRTRRERLRPSPALVAAGSPRRRTPGMRREEVAALCGVSPTWYSWIEQGRDVSVSPAALARLADALRLSAAERGYLFDLARKRDPAAAPLGDAEALPAALLAAVHAITTPAYVLDRLWDVRAWNPPAASLFADWIGGSERNLLRYVFLDPSAQTFIQDWPERARRLIAEFRADIGRAVEDPALRALADGLRDRSAAFARWWQQQDVQEREGGLRRFRHPVDGPLEYEQLTLRPAVRPDCKLVLLLGPQPAGA
jgi:transcriptional regulator with XRE-family HTH domain